MDTNNKAELKRVWLEALRSGEYKQTKGTLHNRDDGGFCCLGVAAKVWGIATPKQMGVASWKDFDGEKLPSHEGNIRLYDALDKLTGILSEELDSTKRSEFVSKGIRMNDGGKSFAEIADMIEKEWVIDPLEGSALRSFDEYGDNNG